MSSYNERLQQIEELLALKPSLNEAPEQLLRAEITRYVAARYEGSRLGLREKSQLSFDLYATMRGLTSSRNSLRTRKSVKSWSMGRKEFSSKKMGGSNGCRSLSTAKTIFYGSFAVALARATV